MNPIKVLTEKNEISRGINKIAQKTILEARGLTKVEYKQSEFLKRRVAEFDKEINDMKIEIRSNSIVV